MSHDLSREPPVSILDADPENRAGDGVAIASSQSGALAALERLVPAAAVREPPERAEVEGLFDRVRERVAWIMSRCASVDVFVAAQLDAATITDDVESVYTDLQLFCRWLGGMNDAQIAASAGEDDVVRWLYICHRLIEAEQLLAHQVNQWLLLLQSRQGADSSLRLILTQVAAWHAHVKLALEQRRDVLEARLGQVRELAEEETGEGADRELIERADALVAAGELEALGAFVALARADRARLGEMLRHESAYPRRRALLEAIWSVADLVLAEDPVRRRSTTTGAGEDGMSLLAILVADETVGRRFGVLAALLDKADPDVSAEMLRSLFADAGHEISSADLAIVWRALLVAHRAESVRRRAAAAAPRDTLWQVLAYPHSPARSLLVIAEVVAEAQDDDLQKVFYDCVKSRLVTSIAETTGAEDLATSARFVSLFFRFEFFIQTRYFEQLETMFQLLRGQARRFDLAMSDWSLETLDRGFQKLEVARHRAGSPEDSPPSSATLASLPLPIQRHLARQGCYLQHFACHANPLIAREVVHYLHAENLGRFLDMPELNRQMLADALRRIDLTGRRDRILQALTHPKCPMIFAGRHLPHLGRIELNRILQARSTHAEVKRRAMMQVMRQQPSSS